MLTCGERETLSGLLDLCLHGETLDDLSIRRGARTAVIVKANTATPPGVARNGDRLKVVVGAGWTTGDVLAELDAFFDTAGGLVARYALCVPRPLHELTLTLVLR